MVKDVVQLIREIGTELPAIDSSNFKGKSRTKESRDVLVLKSNTFNTGGWVEPNNTNYDQYRTYYRKFPVVKHKVDTTANFVVSRGFAIDGGDTKSVDIIDDNTDNVNLRSVLQSIATILQVDGDCYIKPEFKGITISELKILDSKYMRVIPSYKEVDGKKMPVVGSVTGYAMVFNGKVVRRYKKDEIVHIKHNVFGTHFYGISDLEAISDTLSTKHGIEQDVAEAIFRNSSPLIHWRVGNAKLNMLPPTSTIQTFAESIENRDPGEDVFSNDLVAGEVISFNPANMDTADLVKHFDRESRMGFSESFTHGEGGNRSSGDIHVEIYHMNVRALQQEIGDQLQLQLFNLILKKNRINLLELKSADRPYIKFNDMRAEDRKEQCVRFRLLCDSGMSKKTAMKIVGLEEFIEEEEVNMEEQKEKDLEYMEKTTKFTQNGEENGEKNEKNDKKDGNRPKKDE